MSSSRRSTASRTRARRRGTGPRRNDSLLGVLPLAQGQVRRKRRGRCSVGGHCSVGSPGRRRSRRRERATLPGPCMRRARTRTDRISLMSPCAGATIGRSRRQPSVSGAAIEAVIPVPDGGNRASSIVRSHDARLHVAIQWSRRQAPRAPDQARQLPDSKRRYPRSLPGPVRARRSYGSQRSRAARRRMRSTR